jgi:hypothetical protein
VFLPPGELVVTEPVVEQTRGRDPGHVAGSALYPYNVGYGPFTGARPYPESYFAPYTAAAAASGLSAGAAVPAAPFAGVVHHVRELGFDEELAVDADGVRTMKVRPQHDHPEMPIIHKSRQHRVGTLRSLFTSDHRRRYARCHGSAD